MTVTRLEELSGSRFKVYLEEESAFVLYKGELRTYKIAEGSDLGAADYAEITERVLPKRAKLRAMNLLKSKTYTERQLGDKLKTGGYSPEIIETAIEYVKSYGYVDDEKYAQDYIEYYQDTRSRNRIVNDLRGKGIAGEIIEKVLDRMDENGERPDEISMAVKLLNKRKYEVSTASIEEKRKLSAYLYRKGFQTDTIRAALSLDITPN